MPDRILILGGTKEAAKLAQQLISEGHDVTTSLAGRTREPKPVAGALRIGGFGGADGLVQWLAENDITRLIDATHPFAEQISQNAKTAAKISGIALQNRQRKPWVRREQDNWIEVANLEEAEQAIPTDARVLLAIGSQHLEPFHHRADVHFLVRMVDQPQTALPFASHSLVLGRPSTDWREEAELLKNHRISHIVCRNSGGNGAYAKIEAARNLNLPVIMVGRPT